MTDKYQVAPGLWIGSEMEDLNLEMKQLLAKTMREGRTEETDSRMREIRRRRVELLMGKRYGLRRSTNC
jgi:hypothetical protein